MLSDFNYENIYIACGYTDLRYGIDGLAATIQEKFELNPFSPHSIFLFCGRRNDRIKALVWEGDGFLLLYKRLEAGTFRWPRTESDLKNLTFEQFSRLMQGFTIDPGIKVYPMSRTHTFLFLVIFYRWLSVLSTGISLF